MDEQEIVQYVTFRRMITPTVIQVIFWLMVLKVLSGGFDIMKMKSMYGGDSGFIDGLIFIVVGIVGARVLCEMILIFFRIGDNLREINEKS